MKEFQYYKDHQEELVRKYLGKFIVIRGEEVVADYDNEDTAYFESEQKYGLGDFFIIKCQEGSDSHTQTYFSRVIFS